MKLSLFYQNVTVLDYAYLDDHLGAVGNSLHVGVSFMGQTDAEGILYDFSYAKKKVKEIIDRDCDHRLVIPKGLAVLLDGKYSLRYTYGLNDEVITYQAPAEAICELPNGHVCLSNIKSYLEERILLEMPENILSVELDFEAEKFDPEQPTFHYTHGLKDHYGNCQRLFHGHRNKVDVFINGKKRYDWEKRLAEDLFKGHVHFVFVENIVNQDEVKKTFGDHIIEGRAKELKEVKIKYEASQGFFEGSLPGRQVYFLQQESTVENLSMHFAKLVKRECHEDDIVTVRAYEGIAKGAQTTI